MNNPLLTLLTMAEDLRADGDTVTEETHRRNMAHARRIAELEALIEEARYMVGQEKQRFGRYFQRPEEPQKLRAAAAKEESLTEQLRQAAK